jgi:hypothetical protein
MITFKSFLIETPPPEDWDRGTFKQSFKKQIAYAVERAKKLGTGSSRVAFTIPFEGRDTVLKIAKNRKGLAQNEIESDWGLFNMYPDILIPLLDVDEDNDPPRWVHFEKAEKLKPAQFQSIQGYSFEHFGKMLRQFGDDYKNKKYGFWRHDGNIPDEIKTEIIESELYKDVTEMIVNFDFLAGDFAAIQNWGLWKGNPVIIDVGITNDAYDRLYDRSR